MRRCESEPNVAAADASPATTQPADPLQEPVQPRNAAPSYGVGVSVTERWNMPVQLPGQSIRAGVLVTVPGPLTVTETGCSGVR